MLRTAKTALLVIGVGRWRVRFFCVGVEGPRRPEGLACGAHGFVGLVSVWHPGVASQVLWRLKCPVLSSRFLVFGLGVGVGVTVGGSGRTVN